MASSAGAHAAQQSSIIASREVDCNMTSTAFENFLGKLDPGLKGAVTVCLSAPDIGQLLSGSTKTKLALMSQGSGVCCPHLTPRSARALRQALHHCDHRQVRTLRPRQQEALAPDYTAAVQTEVISESLRNYTNLKELGLIAVDADAKLPDVSCLLEEEGKPMDCDELFFRSVADALSLSLSHCTTLQAVTLTVCCMELDSVSAVSEDLLGAIGRFSQLRKLDMELDASLPCGKRLLSGVAKMLWNLSEWRQLETLSLGYLYLSEASDELLLDMQHALQAFQGSIQSLTVACPQDPELGALEAACSLVDGAAEGVREICISQGWGQDGDGLKALAKAVALCRRLSRLELAGILPDGFDAADFCSVVARSWSAAGCSAQERSPAVLALSLPKSHVTMTSKEEVIPLW